MSGVYADAGPIAQGKPAVGRCLPFPETAARGASFWTTSMKRLFIVALVALGIAGSVPAQESTFSSDVRIGPRDIVDIKVVQDDKLNTRATVSDDGQITMPLIGKVDVSGLSQRQAEGRIKTILEGRYMTRADVSVQIAEFGNKPISVVGAVTHPGSIGATNNMTLIQAITQAGGLAAGYGKTLYVLRTGSNGLSEQISIDIDDLMVSGNPDLNLPLAPNDVINIPMEVPMTVYVFGEVTHPGPVQLKRSQNPTLLQAIAAAGGPTDRASRTATIKRVTNGKSQNIKANYRKLAEGTDPDVPLQDGDTIYVKESIL
jgi:polysaccharide export outer membrane protein